MACSHALRKTHWVIWRIKLKWHTNQDSVLLDSAISQLWHLPGKYWKDFISNIVKSGRVKILPGWRLGLMGSVISLGLLHEHKYIATWTFRCYDFHKHIQGFHLQTEVDSVGTHSISDKTIVSDCITVTSAQSAHAWPKVFSELKYEGPRISLYCYRHFRSFLHSKRCDYGRCNYVRFPLLNITKIWSVLDKTINMCPAILTFAQLLPL